MFLLSVFTLCIANSFSLSINFDNNVKGVDVNVINPRNSSLDEFGNGTRKTELERKDTLSLQKFFDYLGRKHNMLVNLHPLFLFPNNKTLTPIRRIPEIFDETVNRFRAVYDLPTENLKENKHENIFTRRRRSVEDNSFESATLKSGNPTQKSEDCLTKPDFRDKEFKKNEEINSIKEELKKLKDLVVILRDQQHVLDLVNDIQSQKAFQNDLNSRVQTDQNNNENLKLLKLLESFGMQINSESINPQKLNSGALAAGENLKTTESSEQKKNVDKQIFNVNEVPKVSGKSTEEIKNLIGNLRNVEKQLLDLTNSKRRMAEDNNQNATMKNRNEHADDSFKYDEINSTNNSTFQPHSEMLSNIEFIQPTNKVQEENTTTNSSLELQKLAKTMRLVHVLQQLSNIHPLVEEPSVARSHKIDEDNGHSNSLQKVINSSKISPKLRNSGMEDVKFITKTSENLGNSEEQNGVQQVGQNFNHDGNEPEPNFNNNLREEKTLPRDNSLSSYPQYNYQNKQEHSNNPTYFYKNLNPEYLRSLCNELSPINGFPSQTYSECGNNPSGIIRPPYFYNYHEKNDYNYNRDENQMHQNLFQNNNYENKYNKMPFVNHGVPQRLQYEPVSPTYHLQPEDGGFPEYHHQEIKKEYISPLFYNHAEHGSNQQFSSSKGHYDLPPNHENQEKFPNSPIPYLRPFRANLPPKPSFPTNVRYVDNTEDNQQSYLERNSQQHRSNTLENSATENDSTSTQTYEELKMKLHDLESKYGQLRKNPAEIFDNAHYNFERGVEDKEIHDEEIDSPRETLDGVSRRKRDLSYAERNPEDIANELLDKLSNMLENTRLPDYGNDQDDPILQDLSRIPFERTFESEKKKLQSEIQQLEEQLRSDTKLGLNDEKLRNVEIPSNISKNIESVSDQVESNTDNNLARAVYHHHSPISMQIAPRSYYPVSHAEQYSSTYTKTPTHVQKKSDLFTSIIEKLFDKLQDVIPAIIKGLVGDFIDGAFFDQGYAGYGTESYNHGNEIREKFRSFGLLGALPLALLNVLSIISYLFKILQRNKFIRNFLVPMGVIIGVTGMVAFLVFWFNYDAFAGTNYNYNQVHTEGTNYNAGYTYKKPYYNRESDREIVPFNFNKVPIQQQSPRMLTNVVDSPTPSHATQEKHFK